MYLKTILIGLFLMTGVFVFGQDASPVKLQNRAAEKMMLRSNTRDRVVMMRSNRLQSIERFRRQENLYQNHQQLQRRLMYNRQQRMMQNNQRQNMQRQGIQRQRMQQSRGNRPR